MVTSTLLGGVLSDVRVDYLNALGRGDRRRATQVALDLLYRGFPADSVLIDLVAFGQRDVGMGWQQGRWTVPQEHRASAVAEAVIQAVSQHAMPSGRTPVESSAGRVVVACVEGEWHVIPGRLVSEVLRIRGFDVDFVGPSVPAVELAAFLGPDSPSVVALTCSMPMSLVSAWHTITAARAAGKTILCGGRGFGADGRWGQTLGADLWADDLDTGVALLLDAASAPPASPRHDGVDGDLAAEINLAVRESPGVVGAATSLARVRWPDLGQHRDRILEAPETLNFTYRIVLASTLVGDEAIVTEHIAWAESALEARGLPIRLIAEAFNLLATALPADLPRCLATAQAGVAACTEPPRLP